MWPECFRPKEDVDAACDRYDAAKDRNRDEIEASERR